MLNRVYARFRGLTWEEAWSVYARMRIRANCREAVAALRDLGCDMVAISGGVPQPMIDDLCRRTGIEEGFGIDAEVSSSHLTGRVSGALTQPEGKPELLERLLAQRGLSWENVIVVADDRNNLPLLRRARLSVGVNANFLVRCEATYLIDRDDFMDVVKVLKPHLLPDGESPPRPQPDLAGEGRREIQRKLVHAAGALTPLAAKGSLPITVTILAVVFCLYSLSELLRLNGVSIPAFTRVTRATVRDGEARRIAAGPLALAAGIMMSLLFFPAAIAYASILVVSLADTAAAAVGRLVGRHRIPFCGGKTMEGSLAGLLVAFCCILPFFPPPIAIFVALCAAVAEALPVGPFDNLILPLLTGMLLSLFVH